MTRIEFFALVDNARWAYAHHFSHVEVIEHLQRGSQVAYGTARKAREAAQSGNTYATSMCEALYARADSAAELARDAYDCWKEMQSDQARED